MPGVMLWAAAKAARAMNLSSRSLVAMMRWWASAALLSGGQRQRLRLPRYPEGAPVAVAGEGHQFHWMRRGKHWFSTRLEQLMRHAQRSLIAHRLATILEAEIASGYGAGRIVEGGSA